MLSSPLETEGDQALGCTSNAATIGDLQMVGANHHTANLAIRSALALNPDNIRDLTSRLKCLDGQEILAISTCNRTEIYFVGIKVQDTLEALAGLAGLDVTRLQDHVYIHTGFEAVSHLFSVACGLNSAVVGESEILGQLKVAFEVAHGLNSVGRILRPLMQRALRVSKRVRSESELGRRGLSVASVAVRRASSVSPKKDGHSLRTKQILIIGAGQIAESVAKNLRHHECCNVTVCSRTLSRAFTLAAIHGFTATSISQLDVALLSSDVIFCAASVETPLIDGDTLATKVKSGSVIVDLGVPANVSPCAKSHREVKIIDMEDLMKEVSQNIAHVSEATPKAIGIVKQEVEAYARESAVREASSNIEALVRRTEQVRRHNLEWALSQVPVENTRERKLIEDLSIRLTRGMLHEPIQKLKNDFRDPAERAVLARFFQAEE